MIRRHVGASALALLVITAFTACANTVAGTATWPGAKLEKVVLTAADFPSGVQFDRLVETPGQPDGAGGPPAMLSMPEGCSDGLTRVIAASAERGAGQRGEVQRRLRRRSHRDDRIDVEPGSGQARRHRRTVRCVSDVLRSVVEGHSDDDHEIAYFAPRRAGVRADHGPQRSKEQRFLLVRKCPRDGGVRNRLSHTQSDDRGQSLAAADVSEPSRANRPSACKPAE